MADRKLVDVGYIHSIPSSGRCSKCGRPFGTAPDAMHNPEKATQDFYAAFNAHQCDEDASQAAPGS